jgi:hypothetical protein
MEDLFTVSTMTTIVTSLATLWTARSAWQAVNQARNTALETKRQADAVLEANEALHHPYLMISPHPRPNEHGQSEVCIVNFSELPAQINGAFLETLDPNAGPVKDRGGISPMVLSASHTANLTPPGEHVKFTVYDDSIQPGWYVLRVMFKYPRLPGKALLLDTPLCKREVGAPTYLLDLAVVVKYESGGKHPAATWTAKELENRSKRL